MPFNRAGSCPRTALLKLSPFGRSQVAEHADWKVWFAHQDIDFNRRDVVDWSLHEDSEA